MIVRFAHHMKQYTAFNTHTVDLASFHGFPEGAWVRGYGEEAGYEAMGRRLGTRLWGGGRVRGYGEEAEYEASITLTNTEEAVLEEHYAKMKLGT